MPDDLEEPARRRAWIEELTASRVVATTRTGTGGSRPTFFVELERGSGERRSVVLRAEGDGSFTGTEVTVAREAAAYRALADHGLPIPRVLGVSDDGRAVLMERAPGTSDLAALDLAARLAVLLDFVEHLADLHALDTAELPLDGFERPRDAADTARVDLRMWSRLSALVPDLDPLLRFTGSWLDANAPAWEPAVFVQGDTGPGNFVHDGGRVTGLVDLEFAHLGDPMDDLAWLRMRLAALDVDEAALHRRYTERSGIAIDPDRLDFYGLAVQYRCAVTTSLAVARGGGARGWAPYLLQTERFLGGVASRLSALTGVGEPAIVFDAGSTSRTPWFDDLLGALRSAVRGLEPGPLQDDTRNAQILVHFLRAHDRLGAAVEAADRADRRDTFGDEESGDAELATMAEAAGSVSDERVLGYLLRRRSRERALWSTVIDRPRRA